VVVVTVSLLAAAAEGDLVVLAMDIPSMPLSKSSAFPVMMIYIIFIYIVVMQVI